MIGNPVPNDDTPTPTHVTDNNTIGNPSFVHVIATLDHATIEHVVGPIGGDHTWQFSNKAAGLRVSLTGTVEQLGELAAIMAAEAARIARAEVEGVTP